MYISKTLLTMIPVTVTMVVATKVVVSVIISWNLSRDM
jgi:hypothetical protein